MHSKTHGSGARSTAQQQIGFWSANLRAGTVTWDAATAEIHGMPKGHTPTLHEALKFFGPDDRARVVEAALAALDAQTLFDIEADIQVGRGVRVRLIGGRGYDARNGAELHGVIETLPPAPCTAHAASENAGLDLPLAFMHELQARIATIATFATLVAREPDDPARMRERVARISNAAAQMQRIFDAVARMHCDEPPHRERIDASAIAARVAQGQAERNLACARAQVSIEPGIVLDGDAAEVELLLENLVGNAMKFSSACAQPQVWVSATMEDGRTVVHVRDNGAGFEASDAPLVFGMFTRVCGSKFPGTGVGLAIAKRIVERHGGVIWAKGALGEGATFSFYL
jgi:signal transduction histidine kinase